MKLKITAHPLQDTIHKAPLITNIEEILAIIFNKLDAVDSREKGFPRLFEYTIEIMEEQET